MIGLSFVLFLIFYAWRVLAIIERQVEGLALAQLSRTKSSRSLQEGVARISPINKPEDLTFDAPPLAHSQGGFGDGDIDILGGLRLEDTVLLASVDGRFHAVNRTDGRTIWSMEDDLESKPSQHLLHNLIRTDHRKDVPEIEDQELYIIEPQSGDIFSIPATSDSQEPLRRLPYSVPQLVEHSPFSFDDPNRVFVGKKETSIIEIDLDKGTMKSIIGGTDTWLVSEGPEDSGDDWVRVQKRRIIQIGRTDYTIKVLSHNILLQTLSFSTYGPNNINKPLQALWKRTPDDIYIQPSWDGRTYAFETLGESAMWGRSFRQPIVAVFDVVSHDSGTGLDPNPIILSQPRPRLQELFPTRAAHLEGMRAKTVIRRIGDSLFAMGHINYPLVNLAEVYLQIDNGNDPTDDKQGPGFCNDLNCYVGVRYADREGTESRITRLLDPPRPEQPHQEHISPRDVDEQDLPSANADQNDPSPTTTEMTSMPFPSRPPTNKAGSKAPVIDLSSQRDNIRLKPTGAPLWTLTLPFVGGVLAIWFILRKFMHLNAPQDRELIRPLQNPSRDARQPLLATPRHSHSRHSSRHVLHDDPTSGVKYSVDANHSAAVSSRPGEEAEILDEKLGRPLESPDTDANITLALEEARVGSGLGVTVDLKDGEDSDKDDGDQQDGKKKRRRGNRGKKGRRQPLSNVVTTPNETTPVVGRAGNSSGPASGSNSGPDSGSGGYVMVEPLASTSVKMELPMPVTTSTSSLVVGNKILGYGSHGTIVYEGSLQGRAVAVKRLLQDFVTLASHEVSLLLQADDHPNVIRYYFSMTRDSFLYIALELCPCSLADLIETPNKHREILGSFEPKRALQQITQGLGHLHNLKIVHRDIKPQNILVSRPKGDGQHRMLISDFGLCKKLEVDQTSFLPTMAAGGGQSLFAAGTPGWRAPEILRGDVSLDEEAIAAAGDGSNSGTGSGSGSSNPDRSSGTRLTKSVDIFALGCLFYYVLVNGEHPFGEKYIREVNILKGNLDLEGLEKFGEEGVEAEHLIEWMLEQDPKSRPDTEEILLHPFFWTPARRLAFLQDASDRFEIMGREPPEAGLVALETRAFDVVGADWQKRMDKVFLDNLGKYRKYQPGSVQDLLRALRNKKNHYQDLPENVKRHLGPLPDGFLSYFTRRFPALFLHVYSVISDLPLRHESMFRTYFELEH
ncbi:hypothetical protein CPB86DRAFT_732570 [Serendipita vermifera]|nr:hypothetical protein CPB86DRAFT_732570 [Serendipita vermifera]